MQDRKFETRRSSLVAWKVVVLTTAESTSARRVAKATLHLIVAAVSPSAVRHTSATLLHLPIVLRRYTWGSPKTSISTPTWTWTTHGRLPRKTGHGSGRSWTALGCHGLRTSILGKTISRRRLRITRCLRRVSFKLASRWPILTPLITRVSHSPDAEDTSY